MTADEQAIVDFLRGGGPVFFSRREIARKAVHRKVFEENPHWVDAPLAALVAQAVVETNDTAQYRLSSAGSTA
jgi:hypothetical protein